MKINIGKFYRNNKPRKVQVKIEKCDTWSLDNTLAHIVHPALLQLKAKKQGTPWVDPADAPHFERGYCEHSRQNVLHSHEAWD